jgi:DNA replication and repair protein RecF
MILNKLFLQNFRNLKETEFELNAGIILLTGMNGHGKTNFLEAVHTLTQGYSFRTRKHGDMLAWNEKQVLLRGEGQREGSPIKSALQFAKLGSPEVRLNGKPSKMFSSLIGVYGTVAIGPSDIALVREGPAGRRRYLDTLFSQHDGAYLNTLRKYQQSVKQRNVLLKQTGPHVQAMLVAYTEEWARLGTELIDMRIRHLEGLRTAAKECYTRICGGVEKLHIEYRSSVGLKDVKQSLLNKSFELSNREKEQGMTLVGPHRDDLMFFLKGKSLREFGSQGQQRSAALALRLAAAQSLKSEMGASPILLLDDIFAELDKMRRERLAEELSDFKQIMITTPEIEQFPLTPDQHIRVSEGELES